MNRESVMVSSYAYCQRLQEEGYELFAITEWIYYPDSRAYHLYKPEN